MGAAGHADSKSSAPRSPQAPPPADPEAPTLLDAVIDSTRAPAGGSPDASPDPAADAPTVLVGPPTFTGARTSSESSRLSNSLAGSRSGAAPARLGPYEILSELGRGGMGLVFRARHVELGREVALKTLNLDGSEEALLRFRSEAQTMAQLRHDNIVPIHDVGEDQGTLYLSMDLVPGGSLQDRLKAEGALEPQEAARLAIGLARGLAHAHSKAIIHRDMKPANVLLDDRGRPLITDFGLARSLQADGIQLSRTGALLGTPAYMPPEQVEGDRARVDERADIYALGATLYQMVTGRPPFSGATMEALLLRILTSEPEPPRSPDGRALPRDLETIILKCLEKSIVQRYASAEALREDLERFQRGDPICARPTGLAERLLRKARRHRLALAGAAVVVLSLLFGLRQAGRAIRAEKTARALGADGPEQPDSSIGKLVDQGPDDPALLSFDPAALALAAGAELNDEGRAAARECAAAREALRAMSRSRLESTTLTPDARREAEEAVLTRVTKACDRGRQAGLPMIPLTVLEIDQQIAARNTGAARELIDDALDKAPTSTLLLKVQARMYLTRCLSEPWIFTYAESPVGKRQLSGLAERARARALPARRELPRDEDFWPGSKAQRGELLKKTLTAVVRARQAGARFSLAEEQLFATLEAFSEDEVKTTPASSEQLEATARQNAGEQAPAPPPGFPVFVIDALRAVVCGEKMAAAALLDAGLETSPHCVEGLIQRGMLRAVRLPGEASSLYDTGAAWADFSAAANLARKLSQPRLGIACCAIARSDRVALETCTENLLLTLERDFYDGPTQKRIRANLELVLAILDKGPAGRTAERAAKTEPATRRPTRTDRKPGALRRLRGRRR